MSAAPERELWQGRVDPEDGLAGTRWHQAVQFERPRDPAVSLLGFPSDLGVRANRGRPGAARGPDGLRRALAGQAWHLKHGLYDAGNVVVDQNLAAAQADYAGRLEKLLEQSEFVVGLGGGHEIGWGSYLGCRSWRDRLAPGAVLGILNFDAHFDLRRPAPGPSSGTPFYQVAQDCAERGEEFHYACLGIARTANTPALYSRARELGVEYLEDTRCSPAESDPFLQHFLARVDLLYLSFCLDVLPAALAPGVSAPAALGVDPRWVTQALGAVGRLCREYGVRWLLADMAELAPELDRGGQTARLGARIVDEMLAARCGDS